ncbi:J domain-containing protein [Microbulbifer sp. OS29]|uniref:J domain-containing protein n=1 Tax=Microbulbifer okhotskensis TaxID=2926617 RepID=A0A9X2EQ48_9GAMM|nr:J domain-containing protein [Microbulbifer okhotskensis]MCO1336317.1 J domain-containing protein [Microbulbifer okhotskensis]
MDPWAILELTPVSDTRAIKRAYAKKLKLTRPDEKPEEFQVLHAAYKNALKLAEQIQEEVESTNVHSEVSDVATSQGLQPDTEATAGGRPPDEDEALAIQAGSATAEEVIVSAHTRVAPSDDGSESVPGAPEGGQKPEDDASAIQPQAESLHLAEPDIVEAQPQIFEESERDQRIEEYQRVLKQVDENLNNKLEMSVEKNWHFLSRSPYMLDEEYNWNLGLSIFERFALFNQQATEGDEKGKFRAQVTVNIVQYCDQLFDWRGNAPYLYQALDNSLCDSLFAALEAHESIADPLQGLRGGRKIVRVREQAQQETYDQYYFGHLLARGIAVVLDFLLIYVVIGLPSSIVLIAAFDKPENTSYNRIWCLRV